MKQVLSWLLLWYLRFWARLALSLHKPTIIGIAGSVGKSSTRNALYALLKKNFPTKMCYGNSETGVPLGLLGITQSGFSISAWIKSIITAPLGLNYLKGTKYVIVEMGIDEPYPPKNMSYLLTIVKPTIALVLNESATHTQQFEKALTKDQMNLSSEEKREVLVQKISNEDIKIITQNQTELAIVNHDNTYIKNSLKDFLIQNSQVNLQTFGSKKDNSIFYDSYSVRTSGTTFSFTFNLDEKLSLSFSKFLLPQEYQELFAAVILVGRHLGLTSKQIKESLEENYELPKGRASIFTGINDSLIIDSSYNASKEAVLAFLSLVKNLKEQTKRPVTFLFGDMRELGQESKQEHEAVIDDVKSVVDFLYCVGPQTKDYILPTVTKHAKDFQEVKWFTNAITAGEFLSHNLKPNSLLLVKGSQNTLFLEESIKFVLKNKNDEKNLCRQEDYWLTIKRKFFASIGKPL